jgi:hypothetical protein
MVLRENTRWMASNKQTWMLVLYLTMRFATTIRQIQNLRAYHAGDKLFVEVREYEFFCSMYRSRMF